MIASTKATMAAASYDYNPELLARVGTEAGNWQYGDERNGTFAPAEQTAQQGDTKDAPCNC